MDDYGWVGLGVLGWESFFFSFSYLIKTLSDGGLTLLCFTCYFHFISGIIKEGAESVFFFFFYIEIKKKNIDTCLIQTEPQCIHIHTLACPPIAKFTK